MALTHDDVKNLLAIIDNAEHLQEMELSWGDFQIHVWRGGETASSRVATAPLAQAPRPAVGRPASPAVESTHDGPHEVAISGNEIVIRAPMLGTIYRSQSPGEKPFVEVGQRVRAVDTVCLIEVMKLFNSIQAGVDGTITQILHENGTLVEFDQPLMVIAPASSAGD